MITFNEKIKELLLGPFTYVKNVCYDGKKSNNFFDEVLTAISKRNLGTNSLLL